MEEEGDSLFEFEQHNDLRLKYWAGQPGNYVGVTKRKGETKTSYYARASVTKHKGDTRRQYSLGAFGSAVAAAIAIAEVESDPYGPPSPEGERKPRTCALPAARHLL